MDMPSETLKPDCAARWREWQFWALAAATLAIHASRIADSPIRGEETRRAEVAIEILQTGDWIVPRQQGVPFLSRPPLGSYPIALLSAATGDCSLVAVRLPSVLATVLVTLLIYGYGRQFLSRYGAFAAGLVFATLAMVLQLGQSAETEAIFTLWVSSSLLVWHWGYSQGWPKTWTWIAGYALAALGALTKGPQAPVYFAAVVGLFLLWRRDWRWLVGWPHLAGLAAFAVVLGAWQIPFWMKLGWPAVRAIWTGDVGLRFKDADWTAWGLHLVVYPMEIVTCMLPWSPLLLVYLFRSFRRTIAEAGPWVAFLSITLLVTFPSCWLVPGAKGRYFMPLYPCFALLIGLVIQRASSPAAAPILRRSWRVFVTLLAAVMLLGGLTVAGATWIDRFHQPSLTQPGWLAALFLTLSTTTFAALVFQRQRSATAGRGYAALVALAALFAIFNVGVVINGRIKFYGNPATAVAELERKLPADVRLVSFGQVETLFTYYYRHPIEVIDVGDMPSPNCKLPDDKDYFCFSWDHDYLPQLPFTWNVVEVIPCDRIRHDSPLKKVIVGKRFEVSAFIANPETRTASAVRPADDSTIIR